MGEDSSTLILGAMCWLLGEEKAKKLARSVGRVSGEYKKTLKELELGFPKLRATSDMAADMEKLAKGLGIDTEGKSKKEIIASVQAKTMDGRYDYLVDPFADPEEHVPASVPTLTDPTLTTLTETETEEESTSEEPAEALSEEPSEEPAEEESVSKGQ